MAEVMLEQVVKRYGSRVVVDHVSFEVSDGEFMVLVGPSGCGKTSTLRIIAGLERLSGGVVTIGGRPVNELSPRDRDIAMVFQNYALYSHLNVHDNLLFALKARKVPKDEMEKRIADVAETLGLSQLLKRKPRQLSGGERQRVALGRAIVRQPKAFLMDEPLSNLDAILRLQMRKDLIELTRSLGSTVIYVTHDQVEAMTMGHRLGVMKDGKLLQMGTPTEVYTRPANRFVAGFIGTPPMNFLTCDVSPSPAGRVLQAGEIVLGQAPAWLDDLPKVDVGVRPADLALSAQGTGFAAVLSVAENLGGEVLAYADAGGQTVSFTVPIETSPRIGEQVWLQPRPERLHFFDPESGERIQ